MKTVHVGFNKHYLYPIYSKDICLELRAHRSPMSHFVTWELETDELECVGDVCLNKRDVYNSMEIFKLLKA